MKLRGSGKQNVSKVPVQTYKSPFKQWSQNVYKNYQQVIEQSKNLSYQQKSKILAKNLCMAMKKKVCVSMIDNASEYKNDVRVTDYILPDFEILQNDVLTRIWIKPSSYQEQMKRRNERQKYIKPLIEQSVKKIEHQIQLQ